MKNSILRMWLFGQKVRNVMCYIFEPGPDPGGDWHGWGVRTVSRSTSKDFVNWTEPVFITFGDTPMEELYTQQTHPYFRAPHIYIAIGGRFWPGRPDSNGKNRQKNIMLIRNIFRIVPMPIL